MAGDDFVLKISSAPCVVCYTEIKIDLISKENV